MKQYHGEGEAFAFNTAALPRTKVFKLVVESVYAKRHETGEKAPGTP